MTSSSDPSVSVKVTGSLTKIVIENVNPVPASRPRVTRWGTYYTKTYAAWRSVIYPLVPASENGPLDGNLDVIVEFIVLKPKTTKRTNPRGDADNYAKGMLDAVTGHKSALKGHWHDDDQITRLLSIKRFAAPDEACGCIIEIRKDHTIYP
jgi:Holliday junction resolvase RusA-like endonuclease